MSAEQMLRPGEGKPSSFLHPERILYGMTKGEQFGAHLLHGSMMCFEEPVPVIESEIKSVAPSPKCKPQAPFAAQVLQLTAIRR
jgi:hypothetical protein